RHEDAQASKAMAGRAASIIGNEMHFDLNFETTRVLQLKGRSVQDVKIHTYCAGLLLLCAQETAYPREEFFPILEVAVGDRTVGNLAKLGARLGKDFVSPTGPLFAGRMKVVAQRETMYHSSREIEQAVFDHFGHRLMREEMHPTADLYQQLRLRMARAAKTNPVLAKALAATAGVRADIDLVAAAKAVAAVETLDEAAYGASADFRLSFAAVYGGEEQQLKEQGYPPPTVKRILELRARHADLRGRAATLTDREVRLLLVDYYIRQGSREIDKRFFSPEK
ncbi:MAG: hypothetical protein N2C14_34310, partial [Planctomycetales bacterium]